MAQSGYTPVSLYYSSVASNTPTAGNLVNGELAINITDGKLYYKDNLGAVQLLAAKGGNGVTTFSAGTTGLTPSTPTNGAVTLAGVLNVVNGGTGVTTSTGTGSVVLSNAPTFTGNPIFNSTGAVTLPAGTTGQEPGSPVEGMIRYNTTTKQFEGYSEVASVPGWYSVGGSSISNDTSTATNVYPLFAAATSGTAQVVYTSNAKYLYKPSTGDLTSQQIVANNGFFVNPNTLTASYTIASNNNASTTGPFTIPGGLTVTVSSGSRWVVL